MPQRFTSTRAGLSCCQRPVSWGRAGHAARPAPRFIEPNGDVASPACAPWPPSACTPVAAQARTSADHRSFDAAGAGRSDAGGKPHRQPAGLLAQVRACLADQIAPTVRFASLTEQLAAGQSFEAIYDGPLLGRGFLPLSTTASENRRTTVYTSDLMHALMSLPAIRAVSRLRIAKGGTWEEWSLPIDTDKTPRLDAAGCRSRCVEVAR